MREIKFRAWDCQDKKMMDNDTVFMVSTFFDHGFPQFCNSGRYEVMQYTGLKDMSRNRKKIYEGHIVKVQNLDEQIQKMELICVVNSSPWGAYEATVKKINRWEKYNVPEPEYNTPLYFLNMVLSKHYEIIGNIYENPELVGD